VSPASGITYGGRGATPVHKMYPTSSNWSGENLTGARFLEQLSKAALLYQPGTVWDYSLSIDVLGLVVERVSGKPLSASSIKLLWISDNEAFARHVWAGSGHLARSLLT
jgi:hypothetical protein